MAKIFHIIGIVACAGMFFTFIYFMVEHQDAYHYDWDYDYYDDYSYGETSYDEYDIYEDTWSIRRDIAFQGGVVGLLFCLFWSFTYIMGIIKTKRIIGKVFNIIGVSVAGIFVFIHFIPIIDPGSVYFDDFGPSWLLLVVFMIPCSIVGLVQAIKSEKEEKYGFEKKPQMSYQPSYNPNHPTASAVVPGQPHYQGQNYQHTVPPPPPGAPQPSPPAPPMAPPAPQPLRTSSPTAPDTAPPPNNQPTPPSPAPSVGTEPSNPTSPVPVTPSPTEGVTPPPPAPSVVPPPPVEPPRSEPPKTDGGQDDISSVDDL